MAFVAPRKKIGRPPKPPASRLENFPLRLDAELLTAAIRFQGETGLSSLSEAIRQMMRETARRRGHLAGSGLDGDSTGGKSEVAGQIL